MKLLNYFILILFLTNLNSLKAQDENLQTKITKNLRCLVCQGQSIYDSDSEFANSLKIVVKQKLADGKNEKEIYDFLSSKYGSWIVYKPNFDNINLVLWIIPYIFLIFGAVFFFINL